MPLLRKQPFHKLKPPAELGLDEEVFYCKITNEIFRDYEVFFERIILCNSLVWSCAVTGRSGLTYQEAEECEEKAKRHLATFQDTFQRPLLFMATMTYRSRLADLNDDVFLFAKDRYFIGETVDVLIAGERQPSKIMKVVAPADVSSKSNGDVIVIDEDSESEDEKRELPAAEKMMYIVHPSSGKNNRVMVKASQVSRKRGLYTRDKSKLFLKQHCQPVNGVWSVKDTIMRKMHLTQSKYEDFFAGPRPKFAVSVIKRKNVGKKPAEKPPTPSASTTPKITPAPPSASSKNNSPSESMPSPHSTLNPAERAALKEQERLEKVAERIAKQEEMKKRIEDEKQRRKEEREKERDQKREEKRKQMEQLKEWSRPREDMECDDLKPLPEFKELKAKVPSHLFGDAVMVLEYINAFKNVFDFKQFFPKGFSWGQVEALLMDRDPQGPLCDVLQMLLCALFNLQEEEAEEYQELEKEETDEPEVKPSVAHTGEDNQPDEDTQLSNNRLIQSATAFAQFPQQTLGMPLRDTLLDQFTLTEIVRLHLMSSGARANSKNARFRYQQRGGYSSLDDPGLELRKQEPALLKRLQTTNVFDLSADDKLRLVSALMQQVMTYAAVRDIVEDSYDKLKVKKYDLKLLQWAEVRRIREDQVMQYKRQAEEKMREREFRLMEVAQAEQLRAAKAAALPAPVLPQLENPTEPEEARQRREIREAAEEARKKGDYSRRELEVLHGIMDLQRLNALYPLGRDRHYRRYWLFTALPALLVEDHELFLPPPSAGGGDSSRTLLPAAGEGLQRGDSKGDMPTLTRMEDHNTSSDKENELAPPKLNGASSAAAAAEDNECIVLSDGEEGGEGKKDNAPVVAMDTDADTGETQRTADSEGGVVEGQKDSSSSSSSPPEEGVSASPSEADLPQLDSSPPKQEQQQPHKKNHHKHPLPEPKWFVFDSATGLQDLMSALNPRGYRESGLHAALQDFKPLLVQTIASCPLDQLCPPPPQEGGPGTQAHNTRTCAPKVVEGDTQSDSASEAIELTLRDGLLDLEERIFVGSLGYLKIKDRISWRAALENGSYSPQTDESPFAEVQSPKKNKNATKSGVVSIPEELVARDMAHALVQIARGVEQRFMTQPLGDEDRRKKDKEADTSEKEHKRRTIFERWEESALGCSSLSQVFLHLATLDKSIKWDRSALLARCRICRRKGDAEKMLLCDKCDRGHHMYCLKPPMTKVPSGDWFCPNCRPKMPAPSPRKNRRRTFSEVEEEEEEEEPLELEETIQEASEEEEEGSEREEEEGVGEDDEEEDSEEEVENEDACAECREDGKLILCDVCPRSYHLHCARPVLKKVPKGKWMCQVCVGGGRAGKIQFGKPKPKPTATPGSNNSSGKAKEGSSSSSAKKETPKSQNSSASGSKSSGKASSRPGSRRETPRNSPTPTSGKAVKESPLSRNVTPRSQGQKGKEAAPKQRGDKDSTPKSWDGPAAKLKRNSSSTSRLSTDSDFETSARQYTSSKRGNTQVQQMHAVEDLLQDLIRHDDAWPFLKPVDKKLVPDYYEVIATPMDLSTIRNKVHKFKYSLPCQLLADVRLIFNNCIEYNARTTPEYRAGQALTKFFTTRVRELGLQEEPGSTTPPAPAPPASKKQRR